MSGSEEGKEPTPMIVYTDSSYGRDETPKNMAASYLTDGGLWGAMAKVAPFSAAPPKHRVAIEYTDLAAVDFAIKNLDYPGRKYTVIVNNDDVLAFLTSWQEACAPVTDEICTIGWVGQLAEWSRSSKGRVTFRADRTHTSTRVSKMMGGAHRLAHEVRRYHSGKSPWEDTVRSVKAAVPVALMKNTLEHSTDQPKMEWVEVEWIDASEGVQIHGCLSSQAPTHTTGIDARGGPDTRTKDGTPAFAGEEGWVWPSSI